MMTRRDRPMFATPLLIAVLLLSSGGAAQPQRLSQSSFTSAKECGTCHEEIYNQWSQSMHSRSLTDPVYRAVIDEMMKETAGLQKAFCLSCHAPISSAAGKLVNLSKPLDWTAFDEVELQGVTCDFCHTISSGDNLGKNISVGPYVYPRRGAMALKYGRHEDSDNSNHGTEVSRFLTSAELCAVCHRLKHPVAGVEIQNTYAEWLKGPYSKQGVRCQDCHMPAYAGATARGGKPREQIHAHAFLGGHSEMVRKAATLTLWGVPQKKERGSRLAVTANLTNSGAGHAIPTGLPGLREMWLDIQVLGPQGQILGLRKFRYGQRLIRRDGSDALPWEAFRTVEDDRIEPRKSRQHRFSVPLPAGIRGDIKIQAKLSIRLISEGMSRRLKLPAPDPVVMTVAESLVSIH